MDVNSAFQAYLGDRSDTRLEEVIRQGEPLVRHFARQYNYGCPFEDLYQAGMLGLLRAVKSYSGKAAFSTWASWCIRSEMQHLARSEQGYRQAVEPLEELDEADAVGQAAAHAPYRSFHLAVEDRMMLEQAWKKLSDLQKRVMQALYFKEMTQEQTAKELGMNQRKVSRIKVTGLNLILGIVSSYER